MEEEKVIAEGTLARGEAQRGSAGLEHRLVLSEYSSARYHTSVIEEILLAYIGKRIRIIEVTE